VVNKTCPDPLRPVGYFPYMGPRDLGVIVGV
jgi:hypothetical protein